ncbi:MAG: ABC transporter permease [Ruminococcaceae bacterium]|nr:ABC transporter permease [Oscillospiraceae bacterium]
MKKRLASPLANTKSGLASLSSSILCILIGLVVGFILLVVLAWITMIQEGQSFTFSELINTVIDNGLTPMLHGGFYEKSNAMGMGVRTELLKTAPLILTGLSVAFAFKTGLFNIGAAGQYTVGAFGALLCAIIFQWPWWACLIASALFGALWGAFPGIFKAFLNVNEVITAIMFNWIGLYAVNTIMYDKGSSPMFNALKSKTYELSQKSPDSIIPTFNVEVGGKDYFSPMREPSIAIFIAIAVAIVIWVIIKKTTFGYELKACGHNKDAAKYAGINDKKNIILSMVIAGALAGLGAGLYYLTGTKEWEPMQSTALPADGFNGISVALLASSNPLGTIFSALFISHITLGGTFMEAKLFPQEVADIVSGVVIYLCAFSMLFKGAVMKLLSGKQKENVNAEVTVAAPGADDGKEDEA